MRQADTGTADCALTLQAKADLRGVFSFGDVQFGVEQAKRYAVKLDRVFQLRPANPRMGHAVDPVAPGVRWHEHAAHVIFYEVASSGIVTLAVAHVRSVKRLTF